MSITASQTPDIRGQLNDAPPGLLSDVLREVGFGDVFSMILAGLTPTEAAAAVTSNAKTLANPAGILLDVVATAGTHTGRKQLLKGPSTLIPAAGQAVWDGASSVRFAAADGVTAANFLYTNASAPVEVSYFGRNLGQRD